jgi:predicted CXXCH cytochrome family protein
MKKAVITALCVALGVLMIASAIIAAPYGYRTGSYEGGTGIYNTPHDLRTGTIAGDIYNVAGADPLNRLCIFCHAPHHTVKPGSAEAEGVDYLPLWNHVVTAQIYETYDNGADDPDDLTSGHQLNAVVGQPGSVSRLCLSCHDGTVAINQYGFTPGDARSQQRGSNVIADQYMIGAGGDLRNHHPIGFNYRDVAADDFEIADPDSTVINAAVNKSLNIADVLYQDQMECVTCHDVHNSNNQGAEKFLWKSDANSSFCVTCHLKAKSFTGVAPRS